MEKLTGGKRTQSPESGAAKDEPASPGQGSHRRARLAEKRSREPGLSPEDEDEAHIFAAFDASFKGASRGFSCSSLFRERSSGSVTRLQAQDRPQPSPARAHRGEAPYVRPLREGLQLRLESPKPSENSRWREARGMQGMRENLRPQLLPHSPPEAAPTARGAVRSAPPAAAPLWCPLWLWLRTCSSEVLGLQALGHWALSSCPCSWQAASGPEPDSSAAAGCSDHPSRARAPALKLSPCPQELDPLCVLRAGHRPR